MAVETGFCDDDSDLSCHAAEYEVEGKILVGVNVY
jgi:hypothetical protein